MNTKPYRSVDFNDERKWKSKHPLDDVLQVGVHKAMGYVCEPNVPNMSELKATLEEQGKLTYICEVDEDNWCRTLWAGDIKMIQAVIDKQKDILLKAGWTTDARKLFFRVCKTDVDHEKFDINVNQLVSKENQLINKDLYHLICDLFNSWCLWCDSKNRVWKDGMKEPLRANPYDPDQEER